MKKIYQKPYVLQVLVNVENTILAGSPGLQSTGYNSSSESLSREGDSLWDDED
jgi:hypothetical protein